MNSLNNLLDKARKVCSTDMAVAARLGVTRSAVSKWRKGGLITPEHVARLIEIANADPAIAASILAEQDPKGAGGRVWADVAKRLGAAAVVVLAVALPYQGARAANVQAEHGSACTLCAIFRCYMRKWRAMMDHRQGIRHASPVLA